MCQSSEWDTFPCKFTHTHACMHACMPACIHIHLHTHTHSHTDLENLEKDAATLPEVQQLQWQLLS